MLYINLLVLSMSLNNFQSWINAKNFFIESLLLVYINVPWHFLIAPFFYTFLINYLEIEKRSKNILKINILLFILIVSIRICFVLFLKEENSENIIYLFEKYSSVEEIISSIVSLSIFIYSFYILSKKENLFSKILSFDNLKWIYTFFKIGLLSYIFWFIAQVTKVALNFQDFIYAYYPLRILTTVLIYWLGYQAIIQLKLLNERKKLRNKLGFKIYNNNNNKEKDLDKKLLFDKINSIIDEEKLFTKPKLNVEYLANKVDINASKLSNIIKLYSNKNFNDFINDFRIDLSKEMLQNKDYKNYTITSIGLESGFNSKSNFYYTFKKHTGLTPTEYQKSLLK